MSAKDDRKIRQMLGSFGSAKSLRALFAFCGKQKIHSQSDNRIFTHETEFGPRDRIQSRFYYFHASITVEFQRKYQITFMLYIFISIEHANRIWGLSRGHFPKKLLCWKVSLRATIKIFTKIMPRRKKTMGVGAIASAPIKMLHPSEHMRESFPNAEKNQRLENLLVVGKELK